MNVRMTWMNYAALALAVLLVFLAMTSPVFAQSGPTAMDCYSAQYHAASDCDRLASTQVTILITGAGIGPVLQDCYSARFHAASDCDRLSLGQ